FGHRHSAGEVTFALAEAAGGKDSRREDARGSCPDLFAMRPLFSPGGRARLAWLLRNQPLLAFDWDGTLVPLAERMGEARMDVATRTRFREVARRWPTAIVSGRARRDLRTLAGGLRARAPGADPRLE